MEADLLRQRRNLIVISSVLLIFDFAQVSVVKVSVLGTELLIGNAKVLMICAWILWAYFLLRYYQYWRVVPGRLIRKAFLERMHFYANSRALGLLPDADEVGQRVDYFIRRVGYFRWEYRPKRFTSLYEKTKKIPGLDLSFWRLSLWVIKSVLFVSFQTHHVTDYLLPFVLAFAAPVVSFLATEVG